jgi:hypothetical protein
LPNLFHSNPLTLRPVPSAHKKKEQYKSSREEIYALIEQKAADLQVRSGITKAAAIVQVCEQEPRLYEAYRLAPPGIVEKKTQPPPPQTVREALGKAILTLADEIEKRENCSRSVALEKAAKFACGGRTLYEAYNDPQYRYVLADALLAPKPSQ